MIPPSGAAPKNRKSEGQKLRDAIRTLRPRVEFLRNRDVAAADDLAAALNQLDGATTPPPRADRERIRGRLRARLEQLGRVVDERSAAGQAHEVERREAKSIERVLSALAQRWPQ